MEKILTDDIVRKFVQIGRKWSTDNKTYQDLLSEVSKQDHINRQSWNDWDLYTKKMSISDLVALMKGLTLVEARYKWCGGSGASAIWVFRELSKRGSKEIIDELTKWVFENRWNTYLPFGRDYLSYDDYIWRNSEKYLAVRAEKQTKHEAKEREQKEKAQIRKIERKHEAAKHKIRSGNKAKERVKTISEIDAMKAEDRWSVVVQNINVNIDYYPSEWANMTANEIKTLTPKTRTALIERLRYKRKGKWRKLHDILKRYEITNR